MSVTNNNLFRAILMAIGMMGAALVSPAPGAEHEGDHAIVLVYHHVSDETPASTSVSPAVFDSHLAYVEQNDFTVLPLAQIVSALRNDEPLPQRAIAFTFDDGYESILTEAMPRFAKRNWPFTVFVSTDAINKRYSGFMDWSDLRQIEANGGTIANHTGTHDHLVRRRQGESASAWQQRVIADIETSQTTLEKELDRPVRLFAWPYGEFDPALESIVAELGYAAFGQQSGPAGRESSLQSLPRFPMATGFADLDSFAEKLRTRPLPVTVLSPDTPVLDVPARPPALKMRIPDGPYRRAELQCYVTGQQPAQIKWQGDIVTALAQEPLRAGRSKFNCTAPSTDENGVFFWYSYVWLQRESDGAWYAE